MPLVPHFELSQTSSEVIVIVFVKTIRLESIEVLLDDDSVLHFHAHPYSLTLNFAPCQFDAEAQGIVSAQYDPSLSQIRIPIMKANKGENWPNLDMTARLVAPKEIPKQWLHAVVDSQENDSELNDKIITSDAGSQAKGVTIGQQLESRSPSYGYGFGNLFQNIFTDYCRSGIAQEMLSLEDPENTEFSERRSQRIDQELEDFDPDRYDYEIQDDYLYDMVMDFVPFWKQNCAKTENRSTDDLAKSLETKLNISDKESSAKEPSNSSPFTADEKLKLSTIPYPLIPDKLLRISDSSCAEPLWYGLLDLLLPFVYDHLMNMGDPTVESAWAITKLSCSLSWLDPPTTAREAIIGSTRRLLTYPYWRNLDFALKVWDHLLSMLESRDAVYLVVKCLLQIRSILEKSEFYYVGNKIFVDPYLYWVQHQDGSGLKAVARKIRDGLGKGNLKEDVGLDLAIYENLVFGKEEKEDSGDDDTSSSSEDSDSDGEDDDEDDSTSGNNSKADEEQVHVEQKEMTERAEVSSTLLELEDDEAPRSNMLSVVEDPVAASSTGGKLLIEELN